MDTLLQDIRYASRLLVKNPVFALVAVIALALGIGAATAIFSVINAVLLKPLKFKEPSRLVQIWGKFDKEGIPRNWISEPELWDLRRQSRSFEDIAAYRAVGANLTGSGDAIRVNAALVNASFFPVLGIEAAQGRTFRDSEDRPGANNEVVISDSLWRSRFASNPGIVGRPITLSGQSYKVVGIMPPGFYYPEKSEIWSPLGLDPANPANRGSHSLDVLARLKPDVSLQQASSDMASVANALQTQYPGNYGGDSGWGLYVVPLKTQIVGEVRTAMLVLLGAVAFLLLIACANVANLLLARATVREKEVAIRAALGAARRRLVRQLLTESVMLALGGGAFGFALAYAAVKAFVTFGPKDIPRLNEVSINAPVLAVAIGLSFMTGLIFGVVPALHLSRPDLGESLKEGGRTQGSGRSGLRNAFVVSEVAIALLLLVGAGLMSKSFERLLQVPLGFNTDHVLTFRIALPQKTYSDDSHLRGFYDGLLDKVRRIPGVESAGAISQLPLSGAYSSGTTIVEDTSAGPGLMRAMGLYPFLEADRRSVVPGYFESMEIPLKEGRLFTQADNDMAPKVVVVDEKFAHTFWPKSDALGKRVLVGGSRENPDWGVIVGIVAHVRHYGTEKEGREQIYFPFDQRPPSSMYLTVRTHGDPASITGEVRSAVSSIDRAEPIYEVKTMEELLSGSIAQPRLYLALFIAFAAVALVLAAVGIYGVMSYSVTQRTNEIGVRMALGASTTDVVLLVISKGVILTAGGLAIGIGGALGLTRLMSSLLYGVSPTDPFIFATISVLLAAVAIAACAIPTRRAARVDPMVALRYE